MASDEEAQPSASGVGRDMSAPHQRGYDTLGHAIKRGATQGLLGGLVLGLVWGIWQEKKFVLVNVMKEHHLREPPIRLFSIMTRSAHTSFVAALFLSVFHGTSFVLRDTPHFWPPMAAAIAGCTAGAARSALSPVALHPLLHAQRAGAAGLLSCGVYTVSEVVEQYAQAHERARRPPEGAG